MGEYIDSLEYARVLSALNTNSGYWQFEVGTSDHEKVAFNSLHELYEFIRILFGLKNVVAIFPTVKNIVLFSVKWQFALIYRGDIIIFL